MTQVGDKSEAQHERQEYPEKPHLRRDDPNLQDVTWLRLETDREEEEDNSDFSDPLVDRGMGDDPEEVRPEQQAGQDLAHDGRLANSFEKFPEQLRRREDQEDVEQSGRQMLHGLPLFHQALDLDPGDPPAFQFDHRQLYPLLLDNVAALRHPLRLGLHESSQRLVLRGLGEQQAVLFLQVLDAQARIDNERGRGSPNNHGAARRSMVRYWIASARWSVLIASCPSRSVMVRATLRIRS